MKSGASSESVVLPRSNVLRAVKSLFSKVLQVGQRLQNHIRGSLEGLCSDALLAEFVESTLEIISLMHENKR